MQYTPSQQKAIQTIDHNLQIIACAGSGKTQVISARIVEILASGAAPSSIIAFTFTEKAAGELQDRIDRLARERLGSNRGLADMFVGTIHGYCLNLLQSPPLYRYLKYTVLDDVRQRLLIDRYSDQSGLTRTPLLHKDETLERWKHSRIYQDLLSIVREGNVDRSEIRPEVLDAIAMYEKLLHDRRYLDYTMIITEAVAELESNQLLRDQLAQQIRYVVVDEYQDVNPLQERLINLLHGLGANLCVVGDDDQTIYQWRGSEVQNIITFADRYPDVHSVTIDENFRSSRGIIGPARDLIAINDDRLPKRMESVDMQSFDYGDVLALQFPDPDAEAEWIATKIQSLYSTAYQDRPDSETRGLTYGDFAILLRSVRRDAEPITRALEEANIPYIVTGTNRLFETPEIQALRSVFFYLAGYNGATEQTVVDSLRQAGFGLTSAQLDAGLAFLRRRKQQIQENRTDASLYLQRLYLDFLEVLELREETIPRAAGRTGEIIFYNLGTFSQVISDYETVNFHSSPVPLYEGFAGFLNFQAPDYYPEGWEEHGLAQLDAVEILTVHRAKGKQWPAVFVPALRQNRFPSKRHGGLSVWHIIPETAVANADRYKGTLDDERRLFYVAITRPERYLFCTSSPVPDNKLYKKVSQFQHELTSNGFVLSQEPYTPAEPPKLPPHPRTEEITITLSFSELKYLFDCGYSFKLRFLYGFDPPISRALGYGKSLHDALAEIHAESIRGRIPSTTDVPRLIDEHLHLPFANAEVRDYLERDAHDVLTRYLQRHAGDLDKLEHVEKNIELKLGDGIVVNGRADLIRRTDTGHWVVVDFKSSERVQAEETSRHQLQIYALGFEQLTGARPHLIEVHNLDDGHIGRELVDDRLIDQTIKRTQTAGRLIRDNNLPRLPAWTHNCDICDFAGICRSNAA